MRSAVGLSVDRPDRALGLRQGNRRGERTWEQVYGASQATEIEPHLASSTGTMNGQDPAHLPHRLRALVEAELQSGERLVWLGQPIPGRLARGTWPIVLFGVPWTAFALFWTGMAAWGTSQASEAGSGLFRAFPLFGVPFILIGVAMLSSPYWARRRALGSAYAITDRRAILFAAGWRGSVTIRSFEPERLTDLRRKQHADGSGDLVFAQDLRRDSEGHRHATDVGFLVIRDVKGVEELVRTLAQRHG